MDWLSTVQGILAATARMATPLLFASMGGLFSARSGHISMFLEGFMLIGAFLGFVGSATVGSAYVGALLALVGGVLISLVFAFFAITAKANQTLIGIGINIFALGITSYLVTVFYGFGNRPYNIDVFTNIRIPLLADIPIIGSLFNLNLFTYVAFLLVPIVWYVLYKTPAGLTIRAVGEHPKAVDTLGGGCHQDSLHLHYDCRCARCTRRCSSLDRADGAIHGKYHIRQRLYCFSCTHFWSFYAQRCSDRRSHLRLC